MNKNPFSIYDFMGYLFPGVVVLLLCLVLVQLDFDIARLDLLKYSLRPLFSGKFYFEKSFILLVFCYIIGHVVAYISSVTIEFASNKIFGYPSGYLLSDERKDWKTIFLNYFSTEGNSSNRFLGWIKRIMKWILKIVLFIFIFPILFSIYTIGYFFDINGFVCRPLDPYLTQSIISKEYLLAKKLGIKTPDVNEECDYHRIIMHYVYLNVPNSQRKTDNYIALYGFLRSVCLLCSISFILVLGMSIKTIDTSLPVDTRIISILLFLYSLSYITFLGFQKFYRRYTLENFMALLTCTCDENNGSV